jgi:hypothetical protein
MVVPIGEITFDLFSGRYAERLGINRLKGVAVVGVLVG